MFKELNAQLSNNMEISSEHNGSKHNVFQNMLFDRVLNKEMQEKEGRQNFLLQTPSYKHSSPNLATPKALLDPGVMHRMLGRFDSFSRSPQFESSVSLTKLQEGSL